MGSDAAGDKHLPSSVYLVVRNLYRSDALKFQRQPRLWPAHPLSVPNFRSQPLPDHIITDFFWVEQIDPSSTRACCRWASDPPGYNHGSST